MELKSPVASKPDRVFSPLICVEITPLSFCATCSLLDIIISSSVSFCAPPSAPLTYNPEAINGMLSCEYEYPPGLYEVYPVGTCVFVPRSPFGDIYAFSGPIPLVTHAHLVVVR